MTDSLLLREATVQEIQLELIRRTRFNAFDGERIYASLRKHRAHWQAAQLARIIEEEDWGGAKPVVYENQEEIDAALGTGRQEYELLSIWWD
jgi:hypothetical protein